MRISKVVATDSQTNEKQIFTFGTAASKKNLCTTCGGHLSMYLNFCFKQESESVKDVEVEFSLDNTEYSISRVHTENGETRHTLKKKEDGHWQVVAFGNSLSYVEGIVQTKMADLLKIGYVNNETVEAFHGDLTMFDQIKMLTDVKEEVLQSSAEVRAMQSKAMRRVKEYAQNGTVNVTTEQLDAVNAELDSLTRDLTVATAQLGELKAKHSVGNIHGDISKKLEDAQQQYQQLTSRQDEIEEERQKVTMHDDIANLVPKIKTLQTVEQQRAENEKKRYAITTELEWQENELNNVNTQLEEKQRQYAFTQDKRNRVDSINAEMETISRLYEENRKLNEELVDLNDKQQHLTSERVMYSNKLAAVEKSLSEVKDSLDAFNIPAKSVGELLETVRVDVKIDEVNSQIEKLQSEVAVKESQIAEKESALVIQVKRFRSVAELDVAVTPLKAKDTILQVLDAKYSKLEAINLSLGEKERNLQRAMEDYRYRILQLENSRSKLEAQRNKVLMRKQEEFKREVQLNSQKVYSDDPTSVFAVNVSFQDKEIEAIDQEIAERNADRDRLISLAAQLEGSIREIHRHTEINSAEMETLSGEKDNINKRYNEIVAQNSSEVVFNYLKALNSDNGTKYLLDVQQDAVRGEAELSEMKRYTESLNTKIAALKSRLKYLKETQSQLDSSQISVDSLVSTNDKLKEDLSDIGGRLSAGYEQYTAIFRQMESINSKLEDLNASIVETEKTIKLNETQIEQANERAKKLAGTDDLEQAVANIKYDIGDIESERQMLMDSKQSVEKEVFKKRLELEKCQWLYDTKCTEYDELYHELQFELNLKGLDMEKVSAMDVDDPSIERLRKDIAEYDASKSTLAEKIDNYYSILKDEDNSSVSQEQIDRKQEEIDKLMQRQADLEQRRQEQMEIYAAANAAKMKVAAAAVEAKTFASLKQTLNHHDIIGLLIADKIKGTLSMATQYLDNFTNSTYVLTEEHGKVFVNTGNSVVAYDELPDDIKTATYISLILAAPHTDATEGRWLVFEEHTDIDRKVLSEMLLKMDNISYVIKYEKQKVEA